MVTVSPWPTLTSVASLSLMVSLMLLMNGNPQVIAFSVIGAVATVWCWWRDVIRESTFQGNHTSEVKEGIQLGVILFILSEIMFFFSFFFSWFFITLSPDPSVGAVIPPIGVYPLNFMKVPLLNTILLISSGVSITWAHHYMLVGGKPTSPLATTIALGLIFLGFQIFEYKESPFSLSDSVYGSIFYLSTGFHGIHVFVGVIFLVVSLTRLILNHFSNNHHLGFEISIWYWHFVDVIWLFLFISFYWWGS